MKTIDWVICLVALAAAGVSAAILGALSGYDWIPVRTLISSEQRQPVATFAFCAFLVSLVVIIVIGTSAHRRQAKGR